MKVVICFITILFAYSCCFAQKQNSELEITPYLRLDSYPKFEYAINPVNHNTVRISGQSSGLNLIYKFPIAKKLFLKPGIGYYKYNFNKINNTNSLIGGVYNSRTVEDYTPPGPITPSITFSTDKYWYNALAILFGLERKIQLKNNYSVDIGGNFNNYFTFSQVYHITYPSPNGDKHKRTNSRYFGFSAELSGSIKKTIGRSQIGPNVILPVFSFWKQDSFFPQETDSKGRNKWFKGIGVGLSYVYKLSKND